MELRKFKHLLQWWTTVILRPDDFFNLCFQVRKLNSWGWVYNLRKMMQSFDPISYHFRFSVCDCCSEPRYGKGLQLIQMYRNVFKFGRLPFYLYACSPSCHRNFVSQPEAWLQYFVKRYLDCRATVNGIKWFRNMRSCVVSFRWTAWDSAGVMGSLAATPSFLKCFQLWMVCFVWIRSCIEMKCRLSSM